MEPFERSTLQLKSIFVRDFNSKTHSTLREKKKTSLCAEHLDFLIKRAEWLVIYSYEHYTFEQSKFKKDFVAMKQNSKQKATIIVQRDKLLNHGNFGKDCRNNR